MYDTGIENLKKAALSVKVRSFLSGQNGDIDPTDLENPELSLDLQSLIDDPNFEVNEGLFPELLHDKSASNHPSKHLSPSDYSSQLSLRGHLIHSHHQQNPTHNHPHHQQFVNARSNNPLAYLPQPVHGGSTFNGPSGGSASSSPSSSPSQIHDNVKQESLDHRLDFNANTVSSSSDPGYSSYSSNNLTSPSSTSSSSSGGGGGNGSGYSPNAYGGNINTLNGHTGHNHLGGPGSMHNSDGSHKGVLTFNPNGTVKLHHHMSSGSLSSGSLSKKMKNVDKCSDEYKRRRERNNIAVRKSREKAKMRSRETEERVKILAKENERLQKKIDLLTEELTFLRSFFSNVGGLPEQIHREFNKHLETFQHHHIQNGIQFPSFASFKSMQ